MSQKLTVSYLQNTRQTLSIDYLVNIMEQPSAKGSDISLRTVNIGLTFIMWPENKLQLIANVAVCLLDVILVVNGNVRVLNKLSASL